MGRDNSGDEMVTVSCTIERETPKAFLIETEDRAEHWIPKSQSARIGQSNKNIKIKRWLIEKNDILVGHHQMIQGGQHDDLDHGAIDDDDVPYDHADNHRDPIDPGYDRIPDDAYMSDDSDDIPF